MLDTGLIVRTVELGGKDTGTGSGTEDTQVEHKDQAVYDGNAAHGDGAHLAHHDIIQQRYKVRNQVLQNNGQGRDHGSAIKGFVADEFLWVMLLILALVNYKEVGVTSMLFGALGVFIPQMAIAMFSKKGGIGGADIKLSTAAALSLGFYGGVIGYMIGLIFAIVFQTIYNKVKKQSNKEAFPLLPFLSTGLMIGYFI